jgi:hypothetical protein
MGKSGAKWNFCWPDYANPELDLGGDYGDECYVTGNKLGGAAGDDDVDNGNVNLLSPVMDLSTFANPVLTYYRWFYNGGGGGTPNDTLKIFVSNGIEEVMVDAITHVGDLSAWVPMQINIEPYLDLTDNMQVRFYTADQSATGHLVEAGVDHFYVYDDVEAAPENSFRLF